MITADLLRDIASHFDGDTPETPKHLSDISVFEAKLLQPLWNKSWDDISWDDFNRGSSIFHDLPEENLPYFLGAFMHHSVQNHVFESAAFDPFWEFPEQLKNKKYRNRPKMVLLRSNLNADQVGVFSQYLSFRQLYGPPHETEQLQFMIDLLQHQYGA